MSVMAAKAGTVSDYHSLSGTSMATPIVSGVAALMIEANRNAVTANPLSVTPVTPADIKAILTCTARDYHLPGPIPDNVFGAGVVDGYAAVQMAAGWDGSCDLTVVDQINLPNAVHLSETVLDDDEWTYTFVVTAADLGGPIAATITILDQVPVCAGEVLGVCFLWHMSPDLDAELRYVRGDGARVTVDVGTCMFDADAKCGAAGVTETLNFHPTAQTTLGAGTYEIQVHGSTDAINMGAGGTFMVDLSYGLWPGAGASPLPVAGVSSTSVSAISRVSSKIRVAIS